MILFVINVLYIYDNSVNQWALQPNTFSQSVNMSVGYKRTSNYWWETVFYTHAVLRFKVGFTWKNCSSMHIWSITHFLVVSLSILLCNTSNLYPLFIGNQRVLGVVGLPVGECLDVEPLFVVLRQITFSQEGL